eukprot:scaffold1042_cov401-Prasinococcus_capsulatus_cf.AAC.38
MVATLTWSISATQTFNPFLANCRAAALPMPLLAPVTSASEPACRAAVAGVLGIWAEFASGEPFVWACGTSASVPIGAKSCSHT